MAKDKSLAIAIIGIFVISFALGIISSQTESNTAGDVSYSRARDICEVYYDREYTDDIPSQDATYCDCLSHYGYEDNICVGRYWEKI